MKKKITFLKMMLLAVVMLAGSVNVVGQNNYTLVTSDSELVAGDKYLLVGYKSTTSENFAMGLQNTNNRASVLVTVSSNTITVLPAVNDTDTQPFEITLGGSAGAWTLYDAVNSTYLRPRTGNNNGLQGNAGAQNWTISIDATGTATMVCENTTTYPRNILRFNASNNPPLFACYASGQTDVYLYKLSSAVTSPTITATPSTVSLTTIVGTPKIQTISVTGANLTANITAEISGTDAAQFTVNPLSLTPTGGDLSVTYTPTTTASTHTAILTLSSAGATDVVIDLTGTTVVVTGDGTESNPYTVADVKALNNTINSDAWVKGYIVGTAASGDGTNLTSVTFLAPFSGTNIVLADVASETDLSKMIAVQLPPGSVRTGLNLVDNETLLGRGVNVFGTLAGYFNGTPGVTDTNAYVLDPSTGLFSAKTDALAWTSHGKVMLQAAAGETIEIFNVAGQKVISRIADDGLNTLDVPVKGVVIVKAGNRVSKVIL